MRTFGLKFSKFLKAAGLNPNSVAKRIGEDPAYVSKVVNCKQGASPRLISLFSQVDELKEAGLTKEMMMEWRSEDIKIASKQSAAMDIGSISNAIIDMTEEERLKIIENVLKEHPEFSESLEKMLRLIQEYGVENVKAMMPEATKVRRAKNKP